MEYINYLTNCPCCGKEHMIASRVPITTSELLKVSLAVCTCEGSQLQREGMWAEYLAGLGYIQLQTDAMRALGKYPKEGTGNDAQL